jgi:DNA polymerase I
MYDHIRSIAGATYSEIADSNIGIIDMLYLREAKARGLALPTSVRPDTQHYWGAYVFPPVAGKHKNVVYPDLSSLYPNLFKDMNASPETIIGYADDLAASEYDRSDCHTVYVDTRDEDVKRSADEPERTELFVLKPEVKTSFVRDVIGDLIDMKYEYKKDEYADEAYEAVKRITNSVYGCMGDSVSYGVGFRLFDWRIAEAITLAGRDVIKHTADTFEETVRNFGYDDAGIIAGDTDSCVCEVPSADGLEETLEVAQEAAEYVDSTYPDFMYDRFGIEDGNMAVEIESYSESALFMNKKKRYAQWVRWDEGDLVDEVEVKGFELVRSDSAPITGDVQLEVLTKILKLDDPKEEVGDYLKENWDDAVSGRVSLEDLGKPSAISSDMWTYGYSEQDDGSFNYYTPQPHVRGARYATAFIDGEDISSGKPLMFYVNGVAIDSGLPETYSYDNKLRADDDCPTMVEEGRRVDAVSVEDVRNLPDAVLIDWPKMAEKTIRDPIEPIVDVMGWDFDDLITEGNQTGLAEFM